MVKELNKLIWFVIYLVLGIYFINSALIYYKIPEEILVFDKWIRLVGGCLIIIGGINSLRVRKSRNKNYER